MGLLGDSAVENQHREPTTLHGEVNYIVIATHVVELLVFSPSSREEKSWNVLGTPLLSQDWAWVKKYTPDETLYHFSNKRNGWARFLGLGAGLVKFRGLGISNPISERTFYLYS